MALHRRRKTRPLPDRRDGDRDRGLCQHYDQQQQRQAQQRHQRQPNAVSSHLSPPVRPRGSWPDTTPPVPPIFSSRGAAVTHRERRFKSSLRVAPMQLCLPGQKTRSSACSPHAAPGTEAGRRGPPRPADGVTLARYSRLSRPGVIRTGDPSRGGGRPPGYLR